MCVYLNIKTSFIVRCAVILYVYKIKTIQQHKRKCLRKSKKEHVSGMLRFQFYYIRDV